MLIGILPEATYCFHYWPVVHVKCDRHGKFGKFSFNESVTRVPWSTHAACTGNLFQNIKKSLLLQLCEIFVS